MPRGRMHDLLFGWWCGSVCCIRTTTMCPFNTYFSCSSICDIETHAHKAQRSPLRSARSRACALLAKCGRKLQKNVCAHACIVLIVHRSVCVCVRCVACAHVCECEPPLLVHSMHARSRRGFSARAPSER